MHDTVCRLPRIHFQGTWVNILKRRSCTSTDCVWRFNSSDCCPRQEYCCGHHDDQEFISLFSCWLAGVIRPRQP
jgi:hypothetical protein